MCREDPSAAGGTRRGNKRYSDCPSHQTRVEHVEVSSQYSEYLGVLLTSEKRWNVRSTGGCSLCSDVVVLLNRYGKKELRSQSTLLLPPWT